MPRPLVRDLSRFLAAQPPRGPSGRARPREGNAPTWTPPALSPDWRATIRDADLLVRTAGPGNLRIGGGVELSRVLVERAVNQMLRAQRGLEETSMRFSPDGKSFVLAGRYRMFGGLVRVPFRLDGRPAVRGQMVRLVVTEFQHPGPKWFDNRIMAKAARDAAAQGRPVAWNPAEKAFEMPMTAILPGVTFEGDPAIRAEGPDRLVLATPGSLPAVSGDRRAQVRLDPALVGEMLARRLSGAISIERLLPGQGQWRLEGTMLPGLGAILGPLVPGASNARLQLGLTARTTGRHLVLKPDIPIRALWEAICNQLRAQDIKADVTKDGIRLPIASLSDPAWPLSRLDLSGGQLVAEIGLGQP